MAEDLVAGSVSVGSGSSGSEGYEAAAYIGQRHLTTIASAASVGDASSQGSNPGTGAVTPMRMHSRSFSGSLGTGWTQDPPLHRVPSDGTLVSTATAPSYRGVPAGWAADQSPQNATSGRGGQRAAGGDKHSRRHRGRQHGSRHDPHVAPARPPCRSAPGADRSALRLLRGASGEANIGKAPCAASRLLGSDTEGATSPRWRRGVCGPCGCAWARMRPLLRLCHMSTVLLCVFMAFAGAARRNAAGVLVAGTPFARLCNSAPHCYAPDALYVAFSVGCLLAPAVLERVAARRVIAAACTVLFVVALATTGTMSADPSIITHASSDLWLTSCVGAAAGLAAGLLWTAQSLYLAHCAIEYAIAAQCSLHTVTGAIGGIFFAAYQLAPLGNRVLDWGLGPDRVGWAYLVCAGVGAVTAWCMLPRNTDDAISGRRLSVASIMDTDSLATTTTGSVSSHRVTAMARYSGRSHSFSQASHEPEAQSRRGSSNSGPASGPAVPATARHRRGPSDGSAVIGGAGNRGSGTMQPASNNTQNWDQRSSDRWDDVVLSVDTGAPTGDVPSPPQGSDLLPAAPASDPACGTTAPRATAGSSCGSRTRRCAASPNAYLCTAWLDVRFALIAPLMVLAGIEEGWSSGSFTAAAGAHFPGLPMTSLNTEALTWPAAAYALSNSAASLVLGCASDRWWRVMLLGTCILAQVCATVVGAVAGSTSPSGVAIGVAIAWGVGNAGVNTQLFALVVKHSPLRLPAAFASVHLAQAATQAIAIAAFKSTSLTGAVAYCTFVIVAVVAFLGSLLSVRVHSLRMHQRRKLERRRRRAHRSAAGALWSYQSPVVDGRGVTPQHRGGAGPPPREGVGTRSPRRGSGTHARRHSLLGNQRARAPSSPGGGSTPRHLRRATIGTSDGGRSVDRGEADALTRGSRGLGGWGLWGAPPGTNSPAAGSRAEESGVGHTRATGVVADDVSVPDARAGAAPSRSSMSGSGSSARSALPPTPVAFVMSPAP